VRKIRIAVIGSGISGLSCAWLLSQRHDVTLFESDTRLGGHSHTVDVCHDNHHASVDTGFIVSNTWTYPNFSALMDYLDVAMVNTQMTFSASTHGGRCEYAGNHLGTLLGTWRQWASPNHWRMMADLVRFYRTAEARAPDMPEGFTLGQFLAAEGYGAAFIHSHILPMAGAIWSATPAEIADYPLRAFIRFFANHGLFVLGQRPDWRTVKGGSRQYVSRLVDDSKFSVRLGAAIAGITRSAFHVDVRTVAGDTETFDHVVIATHADQALRLLRDPTPDERTLLSPFKTSANTVYLHRDPSLMPRTRRFWSGWNYRGDGTGTEQKLAVTYWMNALQKLETPNQHFVSLNPVTSPATGLVDGTYIYQHPVFNSKTLALQPDLWRLQGVNRTWFAGAWFGSGFHEDGAQAGLAVAEQLGDMQRPWTVPDPSGRIHVHPMELPLLETVMPQAAE
jgi:uncharacterized protein